MTRPLLPLLVLSSVLLTLAAPVGGALAAPVTALYYTSAQDSIGQGRTYLVSLSQGFFFYDQSVGAQPAVSFFIANFQQGVPPPPQILFWSLAFDAPDADPLIPGHYEATRYPFQAPGVAGMDFSALGLGNNTLTGFFDVLEIERDPSGAVLHLAVDFTQYDGGFTERWERGSLRINSEVPIAPEPAAIVLVLLSAAILRAMRHPIAVRSGR